MCGLFPLPFRLQGASDNTIPFPVLVTGVWHYSLIDVPGGIQDPGNAGFSPLPVFAGCRTPDEKIAGRAGPCRRFALRCRFFEKPPTACLKAIDSPAGLRQGILTTPSKDTNAILYLVTDWHANTKYRLSRPAGYNRIFPCNTFAKAKSTLSAKRRFYGPVLWLLLS